MFVVYLLYNLFNTICVVLGVLISALKSMRGQRGLHSLVRAAGLDGLANFCAHAKADSANYVKCVKHVLQTNPNREGVYLATNNLNAYEDFVKV